MLGLIGTVGGAVALEIRRIRKRGGPDEVREVKQREKELRDLLEVGWVGGTSCMSPIRHLYFVVQVTSSGRGSQRCISTYDSQQAAAPP